ncbi:MAG TPA: sugar phosphate isomerase/epimerase [Blastocatellia bacterium]|nr:sugar phosphate isomerase/epimerase [Blastocatellia bacterium]
MHHITRRKFSGILLGAAGAGLLRPFDKVKPSVVSGVEIGVQSYTFRKFTIEGMIAEMQKVGLSSVELWNGHLDPMKTSEAEFKAVKKKFDDAGIRVSAYCVNFPKDSSDEHLDRGYNGALLLGTRVMTASVQKSIVPRLDQWSQKYKIKMGLHNHWFGEEWYKGDRTQEYETPDDFLNLFKTTSKYMNANLDVGHFSAAGYDPVAFLRQHHDRIVSLHVKDRDKDAKRTNRRFGQGATPVAEVMRAAREVKFKYAANLEYEIEEDHPTAGLRDAFEYVKRALA